MERHGETLQRLMLTLALPSSLVPKAETLLEQQGFKVVQLYCDPFYCSTLDGSQSQGCGEKKHAFASGCLQWLPQPALC